MLAEMVKRVEWLTFDCYGTLIDWEAGIGDALCRLAGDTAASREELLEAYVRTEAALEQQGYRRYREVQTLVMRALSGNFHFALPAPEADVLTRTLPDWLPFADTNAALARLKSRYKLAILSNIDRDLLGATCAHFAVTFDLLVTAEDVRAYKPAHPHFLHLLLQTGGARERILHVAQSLYHDGRPAHELGLNFVWINRGRQSARPDVPVLAEFPTLAALAEALGV